MHSLNLEVKSSELDQWLLNFWAPDPFAILKITENLKKLFGEGNGNPLQCSCLEDPRDGGSLVGCHLWGRTESDTTEAT